MPDRESRLSPVCERPEFAMCARAQRLEGVLAFMSACRFGKVREFSMFNGALIPLCPAAIRCALMLACTVSIILFSGDLVQFAVAGTF
ncbi:MAG: hypothetical protein ABSD90_07125 [Methylocystis sp.]|jgi:hypothetical protein